MIKHKTNEYRNIHQWLRRKYGKASKCENKKCLGGSKRFEWAIIRGFDYERKREIYHQLCKQCHTSYDYTEERRAIAKERTKNGVFTREQYEKFAEKLRGKHLSEDVKKKIGEKARGRPNPSRRRPVYQFSLDGKFIKKWEMIETASLALGIHRTCISLNARGGVKTGGGFKWSFIKQQLK